MNAPRELKTLSIEIDGRTVLHAPSLPLGQIQVASGGVMPVTQ